MRARTFRRAFSGVRCASGSVRVIVACALVPHLAHAEASPPAPSSELERPALISFFPKLGSVVYGRGKLEQACDGICTGFAGTKAGYSHEPAFTFGADVLFGVWRYLRVGPSLEYSVTNDVNLAPAGTYEVGDDFTLDAVVEGFLPVAPRWGVAPRVQAGLIDLNPAGTLRDHIHDVRTQFCDDPPDPDCPIHDTARIGWNVGAGAGGWYRAHDHFRVRLDLLFQYYSLSLYTIPGTLFTNPIHVEEALSGGRLLVTAGVEAF